MLLLLSLISLSAAQEVWTDLSQGRNDSYKLWCEMVFMPNHRGWSGNQPPEEWTNVTVSIFPYIAQGFQLTGSTNSYRMKIPAYIPFTNVSIFEGMFQSLSFSIFYWDDVFPIYLGLYKPTLTNFSASTYIISSRNFCDVSSLVLGTNPDSI